MPELRIEVVKDIEDGVWVGADPCLCGGCRPTASVFRDDPGYQHHDPALAEGPCCCGRFFAVGPEASRIAERMSRERTEGGDAPQGHRLEIRRVELPWGETVQAVVGYLPEDRL